MSVEESNNLPSESDTDDEDYVPTGANDVLSEEESGNESQEECCGGSGDNGEHSGKRRKHQKNIKMSRKKIKPAEEKENEEEKPSEEISFEEKKKRASALWEDFMKDVGTPVPKKKAEEPVEKPDPKEERKEKESAPQQPAKVKITELFEFAGEKVEVEREIVASAVSTSVPGSGRGRGKTAGGISGILGQLGKKGKLSTLEKSKLDWDKFKKEEGIDEDLDTFNKGKNGYLEKQDFLQRADLRQFEIEKEMRNKRRTFNR